MHGSGSPARSTAPASASRAGSRRAALHGGGPAPTGCRSNRGTGGACARRGGARSRSGARSPRPAGRRGSPTRPGRALIKARKYEAALAPLERALALDPSRSSAFARGRASRPPPLGSHFALGGADRLYELIGSAGGRAGGDGHGWVEERRSTTARPANPTMASADSATPGRNRAAAADDRTDMAIRASSTVGVLRGGGGGGTPGGRLSPGADAR